MTRMATTRNIGVAATGGRLIDLKRTGLIALASFFVSLVLVTPGQAQNNPICPWWDGLDPIVTTFLTGTTATINFCSSNGRSGITQIIFTRDSDGNVFLATRRRVNIMCSLFLEGTSVNLDSVTLGGQGPKCARDIKAACAALSGQ